MIRGVSGVVYLTWRRIAAIAIASIVLLSAVLLFRWSVSRPENESLPQPALSTHAPIRIFGNAGFVEENGVVGGRGTLNDPYIIRGWIVNASGYNGQGITIQGTDAYFVLSDCIVGNTSNGAIVIGGVKHGRIENNDITSCGYYGISCGASDSIRISGNVIRDCYMGGLQFYGTSNITIIGNDVSVRASGLHAWDVNNVQIDGNSFLGCGIRLMPRTPVDISTIIIGPNNTVNSKPIMVVRNQTSIAINEEECGELIVMESSEVTITGLEFENCDVGISLLFSDNCSVDGCLFENVTNGIDAWGCSYSVYSNNTLMNSSRNDIWDYGSGISVTSFRNLVIENNTIVDSVRGIYAYKGSNAVFRGNNISLGGYSAGLLVGEVLDSCLAGNTVAYKDSGIRVYDSSRINVTGNTLRENYNDGFLGANSSSVTLYSNSIEFNRVGIDIIGGGPYIIRRNDVICSTHAQVRLHDMASCIWNGSYQEGGNFWSDYNGSDFMSGPDQDVLGSDEIGDVPYAVAEGNVDNYPSIRPFQERNRLPLATFIVEPRGGAVGTSFFFNATASADFEDNSSSLSVRWDFEGDGAWDTELTTDKTAVHVYDSPGLYWPCLEVRDTQGGISYRVNGFLFVGE